MKILHRILRLLPTQSEERVKSLYLDLMKKCLTDLIYADSREKGNAQNNSFDKERRVNGMDWPPVAHTMIGLKRLNNIQFCIENVLQKKVPGDLIETGVWRGGAAIFMRAVLKAHKVTNRRVWVADSFEGLPMPNVDKYPADKGDTLYQHEELAISLEDVKRNFSKYDLLDNQVQFLKGWFRDTLPNAPMEKLAVMRLDGDMYESTMDGLVNLYPKLSVGGFVIIDDYGCIEACHQAVQDYRQANGVTEEIVEVDWTGVYW